jgi:N-acetylmuramoyl-L-alanine amidase
MLWGYILRFFGRLHGDVMFRTTRPIDKLIIHCSATKPSMDIGVKEIRQWHTKGNGWSDIGYHYVIRRDGTVETGRPINLVGAHVAGHNTGSHGVCLVGGIDNEGEAEANFTKEQWDQLGRVVRAFKAEYPHATVHGHNEYDAGKACPSFDVQKWLKAEGL